MTSRPTGLNNNTQGFQELEQNPCLKSGSKVRSEHQKNEKHA